VGVLFEESMNPFKDLFEDLRNAYNKVDKNFLLVILSALLFINIVIDIWALMSGAWPMAMFMLLLSLLVIMAFLHANSD
jgi:uncharacterized membrane protein